MAETIIAQDKTPQQIHKERCAYIEREFGELVGKTVTRVRALTSDETEIFGWDYKYSREAFMVIFNDGTVIIPSEDPEGNGHGHLFIEKLEAN